MADLNTFLMRCDAAIRDMRAAGMNDTLISCVLTTVRSAAISGEFDRMRHISAANPPEHVSWCDMEDALGESLR